MSKRLKVFISSRMQELAEERRLVAQLLPELSDESFQVETWVFEADALASAQSIRQVYLDALEQSDLYLGIFWNGYGEYTIDEFERAGEIGIPRLVYVKNVDADERDPRLADFLEKASDVRFGITPRWYASLDEFQDQVSRAIRNWLQNQALAYHSSTSAIVATIPDDVPDLPRKLIGRDKLIQRVTALLEENERVLLRGFGGTGKTALAATIAADYLELDLGDVIWIKAGTATTEMVFEALAKVFDAQQEVFSVEGDVRDHTIRRLLTKHGGLLILDDVWNAGTLAHIARILPRRMPLLATSRQRYPLDEVIEIGELDGDEALKLLDYHARQGLSDDPDAIQLCETLGHHAFALEVAGKTLKVYDIPPSEMLKRIEQTPHDLNMPAGFGELGRTSIKALLDVSIDALDRELYDVYVAFGGMFEPTATAELLGYTMSKETQHTESALHDLVQRGLINERHLQDVSYYQLHDLAYSYAHSTFTRKGLSYQPVIKACRSYVTKHANDLAYLDVEISNIFEAAETAYVHNHVDSFLTIMNVLTVDGNYFAARGHTLRTITLLRHAIETAESANKTEMAHYFWGKLGNTYASFLGNYELALDAYQHSLKLARELNNSQREAILLTVIGTVRFRQGSDDFDQYHQEAEAIARSNNDSMVLAQVLHNRGANALEKGTPYFDARVGRDLSAEAAEIAKQHNYTALYFNSLLNRGAGDHELGDYEDALATHQEAYEIAEKEAYLPWKADARYSMGEDLHKMNRRDEAQKCFDQALKLYTESGWKAKLEALTEFMDDNGYQAKDRK